MNPVNIYTAGLFDGEGSVMFTKSHKSKFRAPAVSVTSTTYEILEFLKNNFGGHISKQKVYKAHHKPCWSWKVTYNAAINFLSIILPYMKEPQKIHRARLLVEKYKLVTPRNGKYNEELLAKRSAFNQEFFAF